jgi:glycosyltransferase involved in cell wall biosynthesis
MGNNIRVNLFGHFFYSFGISEACRNLVKCFDKMNMEYSLIDIDYYGRKRVYKDWESKVTNNYRKDYEINIFFLQPDVVRRLFSQNKDLVDSIKNKYKIAFWMHEMEEFPKNDFLFSLFDEIWVASNFVKDAISKVTDKPVFNAKIAIDANKNINILNRDYFKLPNKSFLFLSMHCPLSMDSRKNPLGPIKAFKEAFDKNDMQVGLIVKVNNCVDTPLHHQSYKSVISEKGDYTNIYLINQELTEQEMHSLLNSSDALISLHRSEGFGLPPAEALSLGKPVISTDWSATRDFLNLSNSLLVNYNLKKIKEISGLCQSANTWEAAAVDNLFWADPDISHAAELMKKIKDDKILYDYISQNGKKTIQDFYSIEAVSKLLENRLARISSNLVRQ